MKGTLILCATPIGNLEDVSARLRSTLEGADVVFAEDTRRTGKLMERLGIRAELRFAHAVVGYNQAQVDLLASLGLVGLDSLGIAHDTVDAGSEAPAESGAG